MTWHTPYEQWVAWLNEEARTTPRDAIDAFDAELRQRLERMPFPGERVDPPGGLNPEDTRDDDEVSVPPGVPLAVESVPSSHSGAIVDAVPPVPSAAAQPVARANSGQLEVALASPPEQGRAQLEVELDMSVDGLFIPTLTRSGVTPPMGVELTPGGTVVPSVSAAVPDTTPEPGTPRPLGPSDLTPHEPTPIPPTMPNGAAAHVADGGEFAADQSAASSQTSGEIVMHDGTPHEALAERGSNTGKIVINAPVNEPVIDIPMSEPVIEEADIEPDEDEADELDATDLVEEEAEPPPPPQRSIETPPTPPPARPSEARSANDARAEPSFATRSALAELQAQLEPSLPPGARPWFEEVFEDHYFAVTRASMQESAEADVRFFLECAQLSAGAHVIDMGCGQGAHALALAKHGLNVTGVDLSLAQLLRASQAREATGAAVAFLQGDMRDPPVQGPFEGVLCVGSTLGYFSDEQNLESLRRMHELLAPGGKLMIEVFNRDHIISRLPARSWWQGRGCLVLDEAHMDYISDRLLVHRTIVFEDGRQYEHHTKMRAFSAHELVTMCAAVGLRVLEISGSRCTRGRFFGTTSPDIWLLAERAAQ